MNDLHIVVRSVREILLREKNMSSFNLTSIQDRYFLPKLVSIISTIMGEFLIGWESKILL